MTRPSILSFTNQRVSQVMFLLCDGFVVVLPGLTFREERIDQRCKLHAGHDWFHQFWANPKDIVIPAPPGAVTIVIPAAGDSTHRESVGCFA